MTEAEEAAQYRNAMEAFCRHSNAPERDKRSARRMMDRTDSYCAFVWRWSR